MRLGLFEYTTNIFVGEKLDLPISVYGYIKKIMRRCKKKALIQNGLIKYIIGIC